QNYALANTDYQRKFMNEKIKHSYQVWGAGNVLLKHEECFRDFDEEERKYYQAVVLLHDVARFREPLEKEKGNFIDHGVVGTQMLVQRKFFKDDADGLAIKHHGHLIEKLYEDSLYQQLSENKKKQVRELAFLVRDADKMANFYLLVSDFEIMRNIFFVPGRFENPFCKEPSNKVLNDFMAHKSINRADMNSLIDFTLMLLAWVFDLNYNHSFVLVKRWKIIERLLPFVSSFFKDGEDKFYQTELDKFINARLKKSSI
ncbi:MAG: HD domain-containing protein, partial [Alphaproteobacteria bacterium]|nr:HD domain-containing protein [Alphaproteobacteria bacterium]